MKKIMRNTKQSKRRQNSCSRRGWAFNKTTLLAFWILNAFVGSMALPNPRPKEDFRKNFATDYGAPLITPLMEDVTLEPNTDYSLRCESDEATIWIDGNGDQFTSVKSFDTHDPSRPYGNVLYLSDISFMNVGPYFCVKNSSLEHPVASIHEQELVELVNKNVASTIYIFVNDPNNLIVMTMFPVVTAYQYQDTTIPCKPTMPSVEVLLTTPNGDTFSSETTGRYDPKRGFVIEIRGLTDSGAYICRPKVPSMANEEEQTEFEIHFVGNEHIDPAPTASNLNATTTTTTTTTTTNRQHPLPPPPNQQQQQQQRQQLESSVQMNRNRLAAAAAATAAKSQPPSTIGKSTVTNIANATNSTVRSVNIDVNVDRRIDQDHGDGDAGVYAYDVPLEQKLIVDNVAVGDGDDNDIDDDDDDGDGDGDGDGAGFNENGVEEIFDDGDDVDYLCSTSDARRQKRAPATTESSYASSLNHRSMPRPATKFVNKPNISSDSHNHAIVGASFQLKCEVKTPIGVNYEIKWTKPPGLDESRVTNEIPQFYNRTDTHNLGWATLKVSNAQKTDRGNYFCIVIDHSGNSARNSYLMEILNDGDSYINISEPNGYYNVTEKANNAVMITVRYRGYPFPTLTWYRPDGSKIDETHKYHVVTGDATSMLKIMNTTLLDSGEYIVRAKNDYVTEVLRFNVNIRDKPIIQLDNVYVRAGEEAHIVCHVLSYPTALVTWTFTPCSITPRWPSCDKQHEQSFNSSRNASPGETKIEYIHELFFMPTTPGIVHCWAQNQIGKSIGRGHVLIGDISGNMTVDGIDESRKIARGDDVTLTCAALAYFFSDDLFWYKDGRQLTESEHIEINSSASDYSYKKSLKIKNIQDRDQGNYECRAREAIAHDKEEIRSSYIAIYEPVAPRMNYTNLNPSSRIERQIGDSLELVCEAEAIPPATIDWYKDDVRLNANEKFLFQNDGSKFTIPFMKPEDEGIYKCVLSNRLGTLESSATVKITNMPGVKLGWILGTLLFLLVLIVLVIYLFVRVNRERKLLRELKAAGLANFEEGAVEQINRALTVDEQADLLPYDRCFEFPREKLKLGKQLGAGAFGVVLKADAEGIKPDEKESVVAVKMVKRTADNEVMRALVSELKIMVHLGQHLNVVNLLGAVTKNIARRELMVIVEYCRYGNVQNFLLRNRKRFIDQINPETDRIDPTITTQRFSDNFELNRDGLKYVNVQTNHQYVNHMNNVNNNYTVNNRRNSDNDPRSGTRAGRPNSSGYLRQSDLYEGHVDSGATENTIMTTIPEDDDNILSNNSVQPAWRSNYKTDSTEAMTVTTSDLVSWAFQVARGMDYLSSKKVLHGDLAARNILLCEENVVKICDFGLARSMYKGDNYKKQGEAPLPIKWLALESLSDHVFSTYTDVWSFGIVLWEFFSLAKVPYPGMDPNQSLYLKLKDGYRMEKPPFANDELYDIMLECWSTNPEARPLFHILETKFARMLGDEVTNHYMDLNEPYLRINNEYLKRNQTDYLALMGSPDEIAPPPPRYVNGHILPEIRIDTSPDDYLQMNTNIGTAIFSPTRPKDYGPSTAIDDPTTTTTTTSFTFPDATPSPPPAQHSPTLANNLDSPAIGKQRTKQGGIQPEEIPMLHGVQHGSDGEQSPEQARRFAHTVQQHRPAPTPSPRHHVAETQLTGDDNYINVVKSPQKLMNNNNGGRAPDAFSNPSYHMLKTVNDGEGGVK